MLAQTKRIPLEFALCGVMLAFLVPELILGYRTARVFVRLQTQRFYLQIAHAANEVEMEDTYANAYGDAGDIDNE
jgi:hypothetical protein